MLDWDEETIKKIFPDYFVLLVSWTNPLLFNQISSQNRKGADDGSCQYLKTIFQEFPGALVSLLPEIVILNT